MKRNLQRSTSNAILNLQLIAMYKYLNCLKGKVQFSLSKIRIISITILLIIYLLYISIQF